MARRKPQEKSAPNLSTEATKARRAELGAELERVRAMTPAHKPGATYPTAEELIREDRDKRNPVSDDD